MDEAAEKLKEVQVARLEKYTYFLSAASGACMAFALSQAKDLKVELNHVALAAALMCWSISFLHGCRHAELGLEHAMRNITALEIKALNPRSAHTATLFQEIDRLAVQAFKALRWQRRLLILGVCFYTVWQLFLMIDRTVAK